jgi:copper homeostasis protein CutC
MSADLDCARKAGADGVAIGADGAADRVLLAAAHPMDISNAANNTIAIAFFNKCLI